MWLYLEMDSSYLKRQTEKACELVCPKQTRYEGYRFWIPKKWLRVVRQGGLNYLQVGIPTSATIELKRFISRRQPPLIQAIQPFELRDCFRMEQERINLRKQHMLQNQSADILFETEMREQGM